ncbi:sec-independent protein translocase protein TatC [Pedobacter steynii]|uniref:Sec-independent protein translocase protein TatC n=1 Tax=Pedobacter steynii TaxID=430522 RepID=A0A1G9WRW4_9SPHI|nr:twin-arginine translocase subunit TatC [Pedobacter steynii]NQX40382.1 twin-arginine translocase subunit TatC [Pedobacter steynii]SDM87344.1 sec-independent protein translocase protein TatC [Pedobacter steynii]
MSDTKKRDLIGAIKEKGKTLEAEMSFFDHIDVLRKHLLRALAVVLVLTAGAFYYTDFIFNTIIMGPKNPNFWTYRMMCKLVEKFPSIGSDFCITKIDAKIINTEMAGQFTLQLNSCVMVGIILGIPYLLFELWLFVKPALHENERKSASGFVAFASFLFFLGILFGYYMICPLSINFLTNFTVSPEIQNTFTIDSYLSSVMTLTLGSGVIFQLPVIIYILSKLGIMTPAFMRASRRYSTILILIVAAIVTPTADPYTMLIVALPLFLLYELSIYISANIERKKNKELYGVAKVRKD